MHNTAHRRALAALVTVFALGIAATAYAQTLPVTYKNSTYVLEYDPETKILVCSSDNTNCVWRTEISRRVMSFMNIAAVATPAGPVIIYCEDNYTTKFALPHFRTGHLTVENSGEALEGVIGRGWLLNCVFQVEQYGAKAVCQLLEPQSNFKMREHRMDINMWGTHKCVEQSDLQEVTSGNTSESIRVSNAALRFRLDVPKGFRHTQVDETSFAMYGPTNDVFMTVYSEGVASPIKELGEAYMAQMGVNVVHRSMETLDNGEPAYLLMGKGAVNGIPSLHVGVCYSKGEHTWVISYTGREDVGDAYVNSFMEMLGSFEPLT